MASSTATPPAVPAPTPPAQAAKNFPIRADANFEPATMRPRLRALVSVRDQTFGLDAHEGGFFPRVYLPPNELVEVNLPMPKADGPLLLSLADGGEILGNKVIDPDSGPLRFQYRVGPDDGISRVLISGADAGDLFLEFWVGPEPARRTDPLPSP